MGEISQIIAMVIFLAMFATIISGKFKRYIPALIGAGLMILLVFLLIMKNPETIWRVLNLGQIASLRFWLPGHEMIESTGVNWQTIIFIAGMMVMVEGMAEAGFFNWLCLLVARLVRYKVIPILISFMLLSGFLAMFIDSITVLLFMTAVIIELARLIKFDPVPVIIGAIFAANVGGSATMSGDPPNIIIGTAFGFTFTDFLFNTGPIAWLGMALAVIYFFLFFRKRLQSSDRYIQVEVLPSPSSVIKNRHLFILNTGIFLLVIILLITHAYSGLSVGTIGVIAAVLAVMASFRRAGHILSKTDWQTLLFFVGLFICVGGLEETGVLKALAGYIGEVSGGNILIVIPIILWVSAVASGVVDNIPFASTMVPVIANLSAESAIPLPVLAWTLALGTDIGGNSTPIGASANVVGIAIAERHGYPISWGRYLRTAAPATVLVIAACWVWLTMVYG